MTRPGKELEQRTVPVQPRGERTRTAILDAAHRVLKARGPEALTTQAVARESGVAVGTVYRLFPNKEAIVCTLYEQKVAQVRAIGEPVRQAAQPGDDWREAFSRYVRTLKAAERTVDFDLALANAVFLIPAISDVDIRHAIGMANGMVDLLQRLGARWGEAALFDLAMTLYCLEGATWFYTQTAGTANPTLEERILACALTLIEPAMRGDPEPADLGMARDRLRARYGHEPA